MRASKYFLSTYKNDPNEAEIISHKLMLRAGIIRQISSGLYVWLPTGIKILKKIKQIIRHEMNKLPSMEISMPILQPIHIWNTSGRLNTYGKELIKISDRREKKFILSPTNEEMITYLIKQEIHSHKQLPLILYQIQTKFRDEIRPRFGVIRCKEFIMKDAYSFHLNISSLQETYKKIYYTYNQIFKKLKLNFVSISADNSTMGGTLSHEFHAISKNGENKIVVCTTSSYASDISSTPVIEKKLSKQKNNINVPLLKSYCINETKFLKSNKIKMFLLQKNNNIKKFIGLLIREDHTLNKAKLKKINLLSDSIKLAHENEILESMHVNSKYLGPIGLNIPLIADISVINMKNFVVGANIQGKYFTNVNWGDDLPLPRIEDIRNVINGDNSPDGKGILQIKNSIEIGHIFQLEQHYSKIIKASIKDKRGKNQYLNMGCYGIGITRVLAAIIEQNYDSNGIIWPKCIAPFQVAIISINIHQSNEIKTISEKIYYALKRKKIEVLFDDRGNCAGVMFAEIELIGIPYQVIISKRHIKNNKVEYRNRKTKKIKIIDINKIVEYLINKINKIEDT